MITRDILVVVYVLTLIPLALLSIKENGGWGWVARLFGAEKTAFLLSSLGGGILTQQLIHWGYLAIFATEFVILSVLLLRRSRHWREHLPPVAGSGGGRAFTSLFR